MVHAPKNELEALLGIWRALEALRFSSEIGVDQQKEGRLSLRKIEEEEGGQSLDEKCDRFLFICLKQLLEWENANKESSPHPQKYTKVLHSPFLFPHINTLPVTESILSARF